MIKKSLILLATILNMVACKKVTEKNIKEEYYSNGKLKIKVKLEEGVEHGGYFEFYKNQNIKTMGIKIKGKKSGLWKHYDSLGQIHSAYHYYEDSITHNLDIEDFKYKSKTINESLHVEIPEKWEIINNREKSVLLVIKKKCKSDIPFCPNLTITKDSRSKGNSIQSYLQSSDNVLSSKINNYRVIKQRTFNFEGNVYTEKLYTGDIENIKIGAITTWIFYKENVYIITGMALNEQGNSFLKYQGLFKDITDRFLLIKQNKSQLIP